MGFFHHNNISPILDNRGKVIKKLKKVQRKSANLGFLLLYLDKILLVIVKIITFKYKIVFFIAEPTPTRGIIKN